MKEKQNRSISVGSGSRSKKLRNYNMVQPMDLASPSMMDNRNEIENPRLTQHKKRKTNRKADCVGS
jgi:protein subunit release factor A